jgi:hypothetical protein
MTSLPTCPRCHTPGALEHGAAGASICIRCGWSSVPSSSASPEHIPTWKLLVWLLVPLALLMTSTSLSQNKKGADTPWSLLFFGLGFLAVGVWSGFCAANWHRTSDGFKRAWRPPSALTAVVLAFVFGVAGLGIAIQALLQLTA